MNELSETLYGSNGILLLLGIVGIVGIVGGKISEIIKVPDVVIYLLLGIAAGPLFLNIIDVRTIPIVNDILLTFGSSFILYEGGREVKLKVLSKVKISVCLLATLGVIISACVVGLAAYLVLDLPFITCLLISSIVASTDPASLIPVFSQININSKLKQTIISESAFNDAVGAVLVTTLINIIVSGEFTVSGTLFELITMIVVGTVMGIILGFLAEVLSSENSYGIFREFGPIIPILTVIFAYELTDLLHGSGYMAVFIAGLISGNKKQFGLWAPEEPFQSGVHFRENIATISRMAIFILLGTKVDLASVMAYGLRGLIIILVLMFIARPLVVYICTIFDRSAQWQTNEKLFMMWVRETGVIPAALSGTVVSMQLPGYETISAVVFLTILITLLVQATTTKWMAQKLNILE